MALEENNNRRQYTRYKRHVNESNERVNAHTINKIQSDVNQEQIESNKIKDKAFEERVYTIFNNNLYSNAMFIDYFKDGEFINDHDSENVYVNPQTGQLQLKDPTKDGVMVSTVVYSSYGSQIELNDFFIVSSEEIPVGTSIDYHIQLNTGEKWNIKQNEIKLPLHLTNPVVNGFTIYITLKGNAQGQSPLINGYSVLYFDAQVEKNLGLVNPDLMRFP